jgi:hypothetical protein
LAPKATTRETSFYLEVGIVLNPQMSLATAFEFDESANLSSMTLLL